MARTTVTGLADMKKRIAALTKEVREELQAANEKSADELVARIKRTIPVGPAENGHLRDTVRKEPGRHELSVTVKEGTPEQPYAAQVEFGHFVHLNSVGDVVGKSSGDVARKVHVPPQPHFFTSVKVEAKKHRGRAVRAVNKAIAKVTDKK